MEKIAVIGLGYVGLPVALAFAKAFPCVGYDRNPKRVEELRRGIDHARCVKAAALARIADPNRAGDLERTWVMPEAQSPMAPRSKTEKKHPASSPNELLVSSNPEVLAGATCYIVAVPTPVDSHHRPEFSALTEATQCVARYLRKGDVVVFESTVYPGLTENHCAPLLAEGSGLEWRRDFHIAYSPERINPGDREHSFDKITKVVAGDDGATTERVATAYERVISASLYRASSIAVAEAAKALENTQRDLNIALMNELALICERLNINTREVIEAAATKWNFLPFEPGLVGGHCVGVDPYYLTSAAEAAGYYPEVILAGRRINERMAPFVAQKLLQSLAKKGIAPQHARVLILGLSFKENVPDLRNTKVVDLVAELERYALFPLLHDPLVDADSIREHFSRPPCDILSVEPVDALVLAVPHQAYLAEPQALQRLVKEAGIVFDLRGRLDPLSFPSCTEYWSL